MSVCVSVSVFGETEMLLGLNECLCSTKRARSCDVAWFESTKYHTGGRGCGVTCFKLFCFTRGQVFN